MPTGALHPRLAEYARKMGADAARAVLFGGVPRRCPWDANGPSLTQARMAAVWADAFMAVRPMPVRELPE